MVREVWPSSFLISTTVPCSAVTQRVLSGKSLTTGWEINPPLKHLHGFCVQNTDAVVRIHMFPASVYPEELQGTSWKTWKMINHHRTGNKANSCLYSHHGNDDASIISLGRRLLWVTQKTHQSLSDFHFFKNITISGLSQKESNA